MYSQIRILLLINASLGPQSLAVVSILSRQRTTNFENIHKMKGIPLTFGTSAFKQFILYS